MRTNGLPRTTFLESKQRETNRGNYVVRGLFCAVFILGLWTSSWAQLKGWEEEWEKTVAAAGKEGKVSVAGNPDRIRGDLSARFKARFGIDIEIAPREPLRRPGTGQAASADITISGLESMEPLYRRKLVDPIKPTLILPEVLDPSKWKGGKLEFMDPEGIYFPRLIVTVGTPIFINTDYVKPAELRVAKDFLNPGWRGKISTDDPLSGGAATSAARFYLLFGEEFVKKFYIDQKPAITRNRRQLVDWLAEGTYPITFEPDKDYVQELQRKGRPLIAVLGMRDFPPILAVGGGAVALMKNAPHPNAARLFVNWIASKEGLGVFSRVRLEPTTRADVDESFLRPELIPRPEVKYFDTATWEFIALKAKAVERVKELLKR